MDLQETFESLNQDKTQIFRFGAAQKDESEEFEEKMRENVKIMRATFCNDKQSETKDNLEKPLQIVYALIDQHITNREAWCKIVQLHTYVYSKIWHVALPIDTQCIAFRTFLKHVSRFLHNVGGKDKLENISRKRKEGGPDLINLKERIQAIKVKEMVEAGSQVPETDDLIYAVGTKQNLIYGKIFLGPKTEFVNRKDEKIIHHIEREKENLTNCKTRKNKLARKDIQDIIFPKKERQAFQEISDNKNPKLISINYLTLH